MRFEETEERCKQSRLRRAPPQIVHIDAHSDLYDDFEGDSFSHASPFARIMERGLAAGLTQLGIRTLPLMFTDLKGSTELYTRMGTAPAYALVRDHFSALHALVARHHGGVVKTIGDAVLLRFGDSAEAFAATHELKRAFREHVLAMSMQPLPIHAAIHRGEVVEAPSGDVFGATVNLAARLMGVAGPDDIVASQAALERMPGRQAQSLGERKFKNVELPVECFRMA